MEFVVLGPGYSSVVVVYCVSEYTPYIAYPLNDTSLLALAVLHHGLGSRCEDTRSKVVGAL